MQSSNFPTTSKDKANFPIVTQKSEKIKRRNLTANEFKGAIVPVLACFHDDEFTTLNLKAIGRYAAWLKHEKVLGICVHTITGEGPALGFSERVLLMEEWWDQANRYDLIMIAQIGGAPLNDVKLLAEQAEKMGIHAVLCLPEIFYKPRQIEELVGYCKIIAEKCKTRPFFYYHIPDLTGINFDMSVFCNMAETAIPNFMGIAYASPDLEIGSKCLREGRVVILGSSILISGSCLLGFTTFMCSSLNIRPELINSIISAMHDNDIQLARERQQKLNQLVHDNLNKTENVPWFEAIKVWFNDEFLQNRGPGFSAGPSRKFFLKKAY